MTSLLSALLGLHVHPLQEFGADAVGLARHLITRGESWQPVAQINDQVEGCAYCEQGTNAPHGGCHNDGPIYPVLACVLLVICAHKAGYEMEAVQSPQLVAAAVVVAGKGGGGYANDAPR